MWQKLLIAGGAILLMLASMTLSAWVMQGKFISEASLTVLLSAAIIGVSFVIAIITLLAMFRVSAWNTRNQILPLWFSLTVFWIVVLLSFRLSYSVVFLTINWSVGLVLLLLFNYMVMRFAVLRVAVLEGITLPDDGTSRQDIPISPDTLTEAANFDVAVASVEQMREERFIRLLTELAINKVPIIPHHLFVEQITGRVDLTSTDSIDLMQLRPWRRYALLKRFSDILMALVGIVIFSPVMLVLCVLIRLESPGNPIFIQKRVGLGEREFSLLKFRSMVVEAESEGAQFAGKSDQRVTALGKITRRWRLDELPQLFNVLLGQMSMIGPRPEQKAMLEQLTSAISLYRFRHAIRPGITGWAQVMQGYADDVDSTDIKLSYDLFYIKNLSLMMDLVIFFRTLKIIISGFGSR